MCEKQEWEVEGTHVVENQGNWKTKKMLVNEAAEMFYMLKLCCCVSLCKLCKTVNSCTSNWKLFTKTEKYSLHMNACIIICIFIHHSMYSKFIENLYYFCKGQNRAAVLISNWFQNEFYWNIELCWFIWSMRTPTNCSSSDNITVLDMIIEEKDVQYI